MQTVSETLDERGKKYGKFRDGAYIMQGLKYSMHAAPNWDKLDPYQRESLDLIVHKIGRILNGDPNYDDNWIDIAGYAQLVVDELHGKGR